MIEGILSRQKIFLLEGQNLLAAWFTVKDQGDDIALYHNIIVSLLSSCHEWPMLAAPFEIPLVWTQFKPWWNYSSLEVNSWQENKWKKNVAVRITRTICTSVQRCLLCLLTSSGQALEQTAVFCLCSHLLAGVYARAICILFVMATRTQIGTPVDGWQQGEEKSAFP